MGQSLPSPDLLRISEGGKSSKKEKKCLPEGDLGVQLCRIMHAESWTHRDTQLCYSRVSCLRSRAPRLGVEALSESRGWGGAW